MFRVIHRCGDVTTIRQTSRSARHGRPEGLHDDSRQALTPALYDRFFQALKLGGVQVYDAASVSSVPPPKLECAGTSPPLVTRTAQYLNSGIFPNGSSTGLVSMLAAAS